MDELLFSGRRSGKTLLMMQDAIKTAKQHYHILVFAPRPFEYTQKISEMLAAENIAFRRYGKKYGITIQLCNAGCIHASKIM
jgi:hypothetical protein